MKYDELHTELMDAISVAAKEIVYDDPRLDTDELRAQALRYFLRIFAVSLVGTVEYHDPLYPHLAKIISPWLNVGYPNPEGSYTWSVVDGEHDYRIFGERGTSRLFDIEVWEGDFADYRNARVFAGRRDIYNGKSELEIAQDGTFEAILSRTEKPGNWIGLPDGIAHIYIRQWFYDWENEEVGLLNIERIGAKYPPPPETYEYHADHLRLLIGSLRCLAGVLMQGISQHYVGEPDVVPFPDALLITDTGANISFRNQSYARGRYECRPDEAVIMEVELPVCEYWCFHLLTPFWETYDGRGRQISLNGSTGVVDPDGILRVVISHRDPGIPNWLDASGQVKGLIGGRYNWTESVPIPALRTVPFDSLREHLHPDTAVVTPAQRHDWLRRRVLAGRRLQLDW
jgi:hypothetical protein